MTKVLTVNILCTDTRPATASIVSIECTVRDPAGILLDQLYVKAYVPGETDFEEKCVEEYWSNHLKLLKSLECEGPLADARTAMIAAFDTFVEKHKDAEMHADNELFPVSLLSTLYGGEKECLFLNKSL